MENLLFPSFPPLLPVLIRNVTSLLFLLALVHYGETLSTACPPIFFFCEQSCNYAARMLNARWKSLSGGEGGEGLCSCSDTWCYSSKGETNLKARWNLFEPLNGDCYIVLLDEREGDPFSTVLDSSRGIVKEDFSSLDFYRLWFVFLLKIGRKGYRGGN